MKLKQITQKSFVKLISYVKYDTVFSTCELGPPGEYPDVL